MIREVIATGRDVNSAIDSGCAELGIDRDDAQFEIISLPKKGFLGLKIYPAKVKVYQELPDLPKPPAPKPAHAPVPKPAPAPTKPTPAPRPAPVQQQRPVELKPAVQRPYQEPKQPRPTVAPPPRSEDRREISRDFDDAAPQTEIVPTPELREKVEKAAVYLAEIMRAMGFDTIEVTPAYYSENVCLRLSGAQLGVVIGRRGETLDALQYLTSLVANRGEGDYIRVNIDSGNYREKREKTLTALAKKLALQAVRGGKSTTLEPMNPYERRVIHGAVSQIRGAVSTSVGADPNRRVVISAADGAKRTGEATLERGRVSDRDRGERGRTGDRDRRDNDGKLPASTPRTPLRPNTNTAASVAAAKAAPAVTRTDDSTQGHTATFVASSTRQEAPAHVVVQAPAQVRETAQASVQVAAPVQVQAPTQVQAPAQILTTPASAQVQAPTQVPTLTRVPAAPARPAPAQTPAPAKRLSDAELYGDIPMGVPIVSGDRPTAPKTPVEKPAPKPEPKKLDGVLYGKVE